jgi:hypothetical protein
VAEYHECPYATAKKFVRAEKSSSKNARDAVTVRVKVIATTC